MTNYYFCFKLKTDTDLRNRQYLKNTVNFQTNSMKIPSRRKLYIR